MKSPADGKAIYERTSCEVTNQVAVCATQMAIRARSVTDRGDANNINTRPINNNTRPNGPPKPREQGCGDGKGGGCGAATDNVCLCKAFGGQCKDKSCPWRHDQESIKRLKASMGDARWGDKRKWWMSRSMSRDPGPSSAPQRRAHATTGQGAAKEGKVLKGNASGNKCNLFGGGA